MRKLVLLILPIFALLNLVECKSSSKTLTKQDASPEEEEPSFGLSMFKACHINDTNIVICPPGVHNLIAMLRSAADNQTVQEIEKISPDMREYTDKDFQRKWQNLQLMSKNDDESVLKIASSYWVKGQINRSFKYNLKNYPSCGIDNVNFENPHEVALKVNKWANESSNGKIGKVMDEDPDEDNVMCATSIAYIKPQWANGFKPQDNKLGQFTNKDGTQCMVEYMKQHALHQYYEDEMMKVLAMDLQGRDLTLLVFMSPTDQIDKLRKKLDLNTINRVMQNKKPYFIDVSLPKFILRTNALLNKGLPQMGLKKLFSPGDRLPGMSPNTYPTSVIQMTEIEVNEDGGVPRKTDTSMYKNKTYSVNKPFIFIVANKCSCGKLFIGEIDSLPDFNRVN